MLGSGPGITAGSTQNIEHPSPVPQDVRDDLSQELHSEVFEGHGRALGQPYECKPLSYVVERPNRNDGRREVIGSECRTSQRGEVVRGDVGGVQADNLGGELGVAQRTKPLELSTGNLGDTLRYDQAAVGRETGQKHIGEIRGNHAAARGDETHGATLSSSGYERHKSILINI